MRQLKLFFALFPVWLLANPLISWGQCATATNTLQFSSRPNGEDWSTHTALFVPAGSTVTSVSSGPYVTPTGNNAPTTSTLQINAINNVQSLLWDTDYVNQANNTSTITFTFNRAVSNLQIQVQDIDRVEDGTNAFIDQVTFAGANNGTAVANPTLAPLSNNGANSVTIAGNVATGTVNNTSTVNATVVATFSAAVTTVTLTYRNISKASANPTENAVGIDLISWCRQAPVANNVTNVPVSSTAGQVGISPLSSTVDGTAASYTVATIPNATTQGTLYYYNTTNNAWTAVAANQVLTPAQAASLRFDPVDAASGNVPFTYTVKDDAGLTSANTATYTIPVNNSTCAVATNTFAFSSRPAGEDWTNHAATAAPAGSTVTTLASGPYVTPANAAASSLQTAVLNGTAQTLFWDTDYANQTNNTSTITFTFNRAVSNLQIQVQDIDRAEDNTNGFIDQVTFAGANSGTAVTPSIAPLNAANNTVTINGNVATGTVNTTDATSATVVAYFPSPVTTITITYRNISTYYTNPTDNAIGIDKMTWCRQAGLVANNVTNAPVASTAGQVGISPLSATGDGPITSYTVATIPNATTQGTLYYNSTGTTYAAVAAGQVLTPAQAASLRFDPVDAASGNVLFTYTAKDDAGQVSNTATYTIPVNNTVCATATSTLAYSSRPAGENWMNHAALAVPTGSTVTTISSGPYITPTGNNAPTTSTLQTAAVNGVQSLAWDTDYVNQANNTSTITFTFNRAVSNLQLRVQDIDRAEDNTNSFIDQVTFAGANSGTAVTPSIAPLDPTNNTVTINGNVATGTVNTTDVTSATVLAYFPSPVTTVTLTYRNISANSANPTENIVGIDQMTWCRLAPVANNVTTAPISNTAGSTPVPPLSSTVDGTVQYYTVGTVPAASQGTLYANGTAVTSGQQLTAAQAAQLTFVPGSSYNGNFVLPYTVTDDAGVVSNTASYTVPVTAPGVAGTPAPCASAGLDGALTTTPTTGVLNTYYPGAATVAAGSQTISLGTARGSAKTLGAGDLVLVMQMQGDDFDYADNTTSYGSGQAAGNGSGSYLTQTLTAGRYEYGQVASVSGSTLTLVNGLTYGYQSVAASASTGQRSFQVVRVPQYTYLTLGADLKPSPWNGQTGGVVAVDVAGQLNLGGFNISATGLGFRGGAGRVLGGDNSATPTATTTDYRLSASQPLHGTKGEGIAGTPRYVNDASFSTTALLDTRATTNGANYPALLAATLTDGYPSGDNARGAPGNAGGGGTDGEVDNNSQNSGGGGGANGGAGGQGGNSWNGNQPIGGRPGVPYTQVASTRLVMGGGGGSGSTNNGTGDTNNTGFASSGGAGGGILVVRTGTLSGSGNLVANGTPPAGTPANDGSGGGGAGGAVLLTVQNSAAGLAGIVLAANGGNGGSNQPGANASEHGPGGGGGGGVIFTNGMLGSSSVVAGTNGTTSNNNGPAVAFNAMSGSTGVRQTNISNSIAGSVSGASCITEVTASITGPTTLSAGQPTGTYTATFTNEGPQPVSGLAQTVTLPAGATLTAAQKLAITTAYPAATFSTDGTTINFGPASLVAGASNAYSFAFTAPAATGSSTITASIAAPGGEVLNAAPNSASLNLTTTATADATATIAPANASYDPGSTATLNATFGDLGPQTAAGAVRTVQLPAGLSNVVVKDNTGAVIANAYNSATGLVTYPTSDQTTTSYNSAITFTVPASGVVTATASISSPTPDANTANNSASTSFTVNKPFDLTTSISGPSTAVVGSPVTFNVTTTNKGPQATSGASQTLTLNTGLTNVYVSGGGYYNATSGTVTGDFVNGSFVPSATGSVSVPAGTVIWPPTGTLPGGQTVTNTVTFTAPNANIAPQATVATQTGETDTTNNTAYLNGAANSTLGTITPTTAVGTPTNVFAILDLASATLPGGTATTTNIPTTVPAGTQLTYTAGVGNGGNTSNAAGTASNVTEMLQLLPGLSPGTLTVGGQTGTYNATTNTITFAGVTTSAGPGATGIGNTASYNVATGMLTLPTVTALAADNSVTTPVVVTVPNNAANDGRLPLTMSVGSGTPDAIPSDNVLTRTVRVLPTTDVATTLTGPASATAGQAVSYAATFTNNGPARATNAVETVQLPTGLGTVTVTDRSGNPVTATYNATTGLLTLPAVGDDAVGAVQSYNIAFAAPAQPYAVTSAVSTTSTDTAPANNAATIATAVAPTADVAVAVTAPATAVTGNEVSYAVTTTNNGPTAASTVATTLQLPANLSNVVVSSGSYNSSTGLVTFAPISSLPAGSSQVNTVTFTMPTTPTNGAVTGTAAVSTTSTDPVSGNNTAGATTSVAPTTNATTNLTATIPTTPAATVAAGSTLSYQFSFNNVGASAAGNVTELANLPTGLSAATLQVANATGTLANGIITFPNGTTYNQTSGVMTFPPQTSLANGAANAYAVSFPAPGSGTVAVSAAIASTTSETNVTDNQTGYSSTVTTAYDATTSLSGPATALPGTSNVYEVTTTNNGPSPDPSITQTVTLPGGLTTSTLQVAGRTGTVSGTSIIYTNAAGATIATYDTQLGTLAFPAITNLAAGAANAVTNTFTVTLPASGSLTMQAKVVSAGESNTGNDNQSFTTTTANQPPVSRNVVNSLQSARANDAAALPISPLSATDPENGTLTYTITSVPTNGNLYYNGSTTAVAAGAPIADPSKLTFVPAAGFVGNTFFTYTATDPAGLTSGNALYTIPVAPDQAVAYTATTAKGGANPYQNGDVLTYVVDPNGAVYNNAGRVYNADGTAAAKTGDLALSNGIVSAVMPTTGPAGNTSNALPAGVMLNPATGQLYVSDRTKLQPGTYNVNVTTTDAKGGVSTVTETLTIGNYPLPVQLTAFTAQAVQNRDALLRWNTASELNSDHFDLERSLDGTSFERVGQVQGQGNKPSATDYTFTDAGIGAKVAAGQPVYYRLRQVDTDGTATFSQVRTVSFTASPVAAAATLYPNPATSATGLDLSALPAGRSYSVLLLDALGRQVLQATLAGGQLHPLDLQNLAAGTYSVLLTGQQASGTPLRQVLRLVKE